jgi:rRNA-processing protein FCF1
MKILIDTNFLLTCAKQKIDLFEFLNNEGFQILIPKKVLSELEGILISKQKAKFKDDAALSIKILEKNNFSAIDIEGKTVDKSIINFANKNKSIIVATLDKDVQKKIKNKKLIIKRKKMLEIV